MTFVKPTLAKMKKRRNKNSGSTYCQANTLARDVRLPTVFSAREFVLVQCHTVFVFILHILRHLHRQLGCRKENEAHIQCGIETAVQSETWSHNQIYWGCH